MKKISCSLNGKITAFMDNERIAIVQTKFGLALLDCNNGRERFLKVGDEIFVADDDFYVMNGQIVTCLSDKICINGIDMDFGR